MAKKRQNDLYKGSKKFKKFFSKKISKKTATEVYKYGKIKAKC